MPPIYYIQSAFPYLDEANEVFAHLYCLSFWVAFFFFIKENYLTLSLTSLTSVLTLSSTSLTSCTALAALAAYMLMGMHQLFQDNCVA